MWLRSLLWIFVVSLSSINAETLRVAQFGQSKFLLYLPLYVADEAGFFREQNLEISYSFTGNDDQTFATLASNSADIAVGDPIFSAIAAERGFQAKTIALMVRKLAVFGYSRSSRIGPIHDAKQLQGLRVGSFPAPSTTFTLLSELNRSIASNPMRIVEGAHGTQLAMLRAGLLDIALDLEPTVSLAEAEGMQVVFDLAALTPSQAITGINVRRSLINNKPQVLERFVLALAKALLVLQRERRVAYDTANKIFPDLNPTTLKRAVDRLLDSGCFPTTPLIPEADWQRTLATRLAAGDLRAPQATEVAVDNRFSLKVAGESL